MWKRNVILGRESVMRRIFLILTLVLTLVPATVLAGGVSVLVGAQSVNFRADVEEYYDISPGVGPAVLIGLDLGVLVDLRAARRETEEDGTGRDVTYDALEAGLRFPWGREGSNIRPDWFVGVGSYDLEIGPLEFDTAPGGYLGLGVEEVISDKFIGRIEVKGVYWKSDTFNTDGAILNMALYFGIQF